MLELDLKSMLDMRVCVEVDFKVVCSLLSVPYCSNFWVVECINMFQYHHPEN